MTREELKIGFVRRGFSPSGGAENYLRRLAQGVIEAGHSVELFTTREWPEAEWNYGKITRLRGESPIAFANEFECLRRAAHGPLVFSLERVWQCDVYRAGDGVHRAWISRRSRNQSLLERMLSLVRRKHGEILRLEDSLFRQRGAAHVIVNSEMVRCEMVQFYGYPEEQTSLIYNGIPVAKFSPRVGSREEKRAKLALSPDEIALLFVGSGWERKGLRFAIAALESLKDSRLRLLVAGRGREQSYRSKQVQFLGEVRDLPALYSAADIFILPTLYDPFSNACLEALASGLPVITTSANGFSEIMSDGISGSIIDDPADKRSLVEAIRLWSNADHREQARPAILELAAQFDISKNVEQTLAVLVQAASNAAFASGKMRKT